jgi:hypothetical protein
MVFSMYRASCLIKASFKPEKVLVDVCLAVG